MSEKKNEIRAREDAKDANTLARAAGQAAMVINGGAATAILAFISKAELVAQPVMKTASVCLALYAIGVCCGAFALVTLAYAVDWLSLAWEPNASENDYTKSHKWAKISNGVCGASLICFLVASIALAVTLFQMY